MEKVFFEVFPGLKLRDRTRELLEMTVVERITSTKHRDFLHIYIRSDHLIPKKEIFRTEEAIADQFLDGASVEVRIYEHFELSDQYTPEKLYELYWESILEEMKSYSQLMHHMLRTAEVSFPASGELLIDADDTFLYREKEEDLIRILEKIFCERCGKPVAVKVCYHEASFSSKSEEENLRVALQVQEISRHAGGADKGEVYFGADAPKEKKTEKDAAQEGNAVRSSGETGAAAQKGGETRAADGVQTRRFGETQSYRQTGQRAGYQKGDRGGKGYGGKARDDGGKKPLRRSDDPNVLYGFEVEEEPIRIEEIIGDMGLVTIRGQVLTVDKRETKSGMVIFTFEISDFTDAIKVKLFLSPENAEELSGLIKPGMFVKVLGDAESDKFDHDLVINRVKGIMKTENKDAGRRDNALKKRVELHAHTKLSDMDGLVDPEVLVKTAFKFGHRAIGITDHGVVQGFTGANHVWADLWKAEQGRCKDAGEPAPDRQDFFKVLYGVEAYLVDDMHRVVMGDESLPLDTDYVVFDLETTGLSPVMNRIIEIGAVKVSGGKITDRFSCFVNPEEPIPYHITKLTSITDADVRDADRIAEVLPRFLSFCEGCALVAHNAEFDVNFIKEKCREQGYPKEFTYLDTMPLARVQLPGHARYTLDAVAKVLGIDPGHHHRAVDDAECTAKIFVRFLDQLRGEGITTLGNINEKEKSTPGAIAKMRANHCTIFAKNDLGRIHLYHLISESHLTYFNRYPKIPKSLIEKYREGLLIGSGCASGELYEALLEGHTDEQIARVTSFYDYLEVQPPSQYTWMIDAISEKTIETGEHVVSKTYPRIESMEDLQDVTRRIIELGRQFEKPVVATGDVHFLNPEDAIYRDFLMSSLKEKKSHGGQPPLYFRTTEEMLAEFEFLGSDKAEEIVVTNTNLIADMCESIDPVRPDKCPPVIPDSDTQLREICYRRAKEMYGENLPEIVTERLERELKSIITNGFAVMYIIAQKLVWKSVEDGYLVGSRGSVGSSFVATMAGITEVNPLSPHYYCKKCHYSDFDSEEVRAYAGKAGVDMPDKVCPVCGEPLCKDGFDIPFETFLGFKGDKEPDIDLNFSGEYQSKAHKYTEVIFGTGQTFRAGTIGTLAEKTAFGFVKNYLEERGIHKRAAEINRLVQGCVGVRRTTGQHPGGIIVLPLGQDINTFTPVQHPANKMDTDIVTTHFDYHSIDHNLLKLDILGHDDPTMIRMLQDLTGLDPVKDIPLDGKDVMSLFQNTSALGISPEDIGGCKLGALGVPEFGTDFAMQMLLDTKPQAFSDLVRIAGLAHGTNVWLGNAETLIKEGKATISTAICTRDDIMTYLISKGVESEQSFKIMEAVRKGKVAKKKEPKWTSWKQDLIEHDVPDWYIWSCERIEYMFPKAHAAAYVMMAWRIAYCKVHYPLAYYAAYFSIRAKAFSYELMCQGRDTLAYNLADLRHRKDAAANKEEGAQALSNKEEDQLSDMRVVEEMYARGYEFMPIDIYRVKARSFQVIDGMIMPSLTSIDGLGETAADSVEEAAKKGKFLSRDDFRDRCKVSQTLIDLMTKLGILDGLPESNQISLFDLM
ncbi:MAG: PolC-type DNA polymerase III [Lachnospiraceae bacterium]|nr:PolC-type DNA polymerase III [Lachnospiraceae bacterium]